VGIKVITTLLSTPLSSYDLTTLDVVKDELDIKTGAQDARLKRYIKSASAAAMQYCNRKFQLEELQDEFWPEREPQYVLPGSADELFLSRTPVTSPIISVIENGITLVEGTDFRVDYDKGRLIRLDRNLYPRKWRAWPIQVQFAGGYAEIPDDVADKIVTHGDGALRRARPRPHADAAEHSRALSSSAGGSPRAPTPAT
jgi:hypothetical protein